MDSEVRQPWIHQVAREGALTAGLQLKSPHLENLLRKHPGEALKQAQSVSSFAFAYSPAGTAIGAQATATVFLGAVYMSQQRHTRNCMILERLECGVWAGVGQAEGSSQQP